MMRLCTCLNNSRRNIRTSGRCTPSSTGRVSVTKNCMTIGGQSMRSKTFLFACLPALDPIYLGAIGKYDQDPSRVEMELKARIQRLKLDFPKVEWDRIKDLLAANNYIDALPLTQQFIIDVPDSEYAQQARSQLRFIELNATIQKLQSTSGTLTPYALFRVGKVYERELKDYEGAIAAYRQVIEAASRVTVGG